MDMCVPSVCGRRPGGLDGRDADDSPDGLRARLRGCGAPCWGSYAPTGALLPGEQRTRAKAWKSRQQAHAHGERQTSAELELERRPMDVACRRHIVAFEISCLRQLVGGVKHSSQYFLRALSISPQDDNALYLRSRLDHCPAHGPIVRALSATDVRPAPSRSNSRGFLPVLLDLIVFMESSRVRV